MTDQITAENIAADAAYLERNQVVAGLAHLALMLGYRAGIAKTAIEGWDPEWHGCVYIDLPTGQVSWHFHERDAHLFSFLLPYEGAWDGHTTPEKYQRIADLREKPGTTVAGRRPTIAELEKLLNSEEDVALEILPNGEIRRKGGAVAEGIAKPLTLRENLGGEYAGPGDPDYSRMDTPELLKALGDDAMNWSKAFVQIVRVNKLDPLDEGFMVGWFANAIEHSCDVRRWRGEPKTRPTIPGSLPLF